MKYGLLATATFIALTSAHHRCDNVETFEANEASQPLFRAYQTAKLNKELAWTYLEELKKEFGVDTEAVGIAQSAMKSAQAALDRSQALIITSDSEYERISTLVFNCNPNAAGSTCSLNDKNLLSTQMIEAGNAMIENDEANNRNINELTQKTIEYNAAVNKQNRDSAGTGPKLLRAEEDLRTATKTYQIFKDDWETHQVTDEEKIKNCQLEQYENDMAEIDRLQDVLLKCKTVGCQQSDLNGWSEENPNGSGGGSPTINEVEEYIFNQEKKYHENGKIRFPDCGNVVSAECFWLHYTTSGWLDFLSFFSYIPALIGCAIFSEYEYRLCLGNFAYIAVDDTAKKLAPYIVAFD